jgi:hypothetical protein
MKLRSKYKNAANKVGLCPACQKPDESFPDAILFLLKKSAATSTTRNKKGVRLRMYAAGRLCPFQLVPDQH